MLPHVAEGTGHLGWTQFRMWRDVRYTACPGVVRMLYLKMIVDWMRDLQCWRAAARERTRRVDFVANPFVGAIQYTTSRPVHTLSRGTLLDDDDEQT